MESLGLRVFRNEYEKLCVTFAASFVASCCGRLCHLACEGSQVGKLLLNINRENLYFSGFLVMSSIAWHVNVKC
jgi:hypothetical protein